MSKVRIYPYTMGSESGKQLADTLDALRVRPDGRYTPKAGQTVINWGSGRVPNWFNRAMQMGVKMLNKPEAVNKAANKLTALTTLKAAGITVPEFTTDMAVAQEWLDAGRTVFERHELRGNSGSGIRIVNDDDETVGGELTRAPLYTRYVPKKKEFRVHVFGGQVFDYAQKKKRGTADDRPANYNKYISSTEMGWVFCKNNIEHLDAVKEIAIKATAALGLDFAAVDVMFHKDKAIVLEVNTAPGMAPSTLANYVAALKRNLGMNVVPATVRTAAVQTGRTVGTTGVTPNRGGAGGFGMGVPVATDADEVTLTIDRATARKLHAILARFI